MSSKETLLHHRAATLTQNAKLRMEESKIQGEAGQHKDDCLTLPKNRCCEPCPFLSRRILFTVVTEEKLLVSQEMLAPNEHSKPELRRKLRTNGLRYSCEVATQERYSTA